MNLVPADIALPFEVTFDDDTLDVAMKVYDVTTGSPVLVGAAIPMVLVFGNTYFASFTPTANRAYVAIKAVYTSPAFAALHSDYAQGSESFYAKASAEDVIKTLATSADAVGVSDSNDDVVGKADEPSLEVTGTPDEC